MTPAFLHGMFLPDNPVIVVLIVLILVACWVLATIVVTYGAYSLARYWAHLNRHMQTFFVVAPLIVMGIAAVGGWHASVLSLPFGAAATAPSLVAGQLGYPGHITEFALTSLAILANVCAVVGVTRWISKKFGYR